MTCLLCLSYFADQLRGQFNQVLSMLTFFQSKIEWTKNQDSVYAYFSNSWNRVFVVRVIKDAKEKKTLRTVEKGSFPEAKGVLRNIDKK